MVGGTRKREGEEELLREIIRAAWIGWREGRGPGRTQRGFQRESEVWREDVGRRGEIDRQTWREGMGE